MIVSQARELGKLNTPVGGFVVHEGQTVYMGTGPEVALLKGSRDIDQRVKELEAGACPPPSSRKKKDVQRELASTVNKLYSTYIILTLKIFTLIKTWFIQRKES